MSAREDRRPARHASAVERSTAGDWIVARAGKLPASDRSLGMPTTAAHLPLARRLPARSADERATDAPAPRVVPRCSPLLAAVVLAARRAGRGPRRAAHAGADQPSATLTAQGRAGVRDDDVGRRVSGREPLAASRPSRRAPPCSARGRPGASSEGDEIAPGRTVLRRLGGGRRYEVFLVWDDAPARRARRQGAAPRPGERSAALARPARARPSALGAARAPGASCAGSTRCPAAASRTC